MLFPKSSLIENGLTEIIANDPSSAVQFASPCLRHALGWSRSIRLVMALGQQVPEPVRNPVRMQIRVYGESSECRGDRHPRVGPEKAVNPWTEKEHSRTPRPVISSMGARHGPTS